MILRRFDLTPYRARIVGDVFTGAVIVSVAFALAGLTWRLAGHADVGAITVPPVRTAPPVPDLAPTLALAPFGRAGLNGDGAVPTTLQLSLKGIVFAQPATLSVAYIQSGTEAMKPFKVGEAVGGATIAAIQVNRVILNNGGRSEFLAFPDPFARPGAVPGAAPGSVPAIGSPVTSPPAGGNPVVGAPAAPSAPSGAPGGGPTAGSPAPEAILQQFGATPSDGGYRIGNTPAPGLMQGDVIQEMNGTPLTSPQAVQSAVGIAKRLGQAEIKILRNGRLVTVTVPMR